MTKAVTAETQARIDLSAALRSASRMASVQPSRAAVTVRAYTGIAHKNAHTAATAQRANSAHTRWEKVFY
jgi:hypothetical protein